VEAVAVVVTATITTAKVAAAEAVAADTTAAPAKAADAEAVVVVEAAVNVVDPTASSKTARIAAPSSSRTKTASSSH
jgi:hypothetical protein